MMKKETKLPKPVETFIRSINAHNADAFQSSFVHDAVVRDVGREIRGIAAIKDWGNSEIFAVNVTLEVMAAVERDGETIVTVKVDGTFDRTGLPDPLVMDHSFTVAGDKIAALTCRLAGEASKARNMSLCRLTVSKRGNILWSMHRLVRFLSLFLLFPLSISARDYRFDGKMSEEVLRSYLSRAMTTMYLLTSHGDFDDNLRMLTNCGVKLAGRAVYQWGDQEEGGAPALPKKLEQAKKKAARIHAADPEIILQACIFEIVSNDVDKLAVPAWAFEELGRPVEKRNFRYEEMLYPDGRFTNHWGRGSSVPDVSRSETKLWFYFLARSYIDSGCEAIHYGQAELMNRNDPKLDHWSEVLTQARRYAAKKARRHFLLCDSHVPGGGLVRDGKLLFDFHSFPLRIAEIPDKPKEGELRMGHLDSFYGRSKGGLTPSGWRCDHLPYLVELDNYGRSRKPGQAGVGSIWVWGWDEITWFSQQPEKYRNDWLRYAWKWVRDHDKEGYLQMPGIRCLAGAADGKQWYDVNQPSAATPNGSGQEETIREIWAAGTRTGARQN